jgi:hypothetical protein
MSTNLFQNTALIQSFKKIKKDFIHIVFLDFIYYIILLFVGSFYIYKILPSFLHLLDVEDILQRSQSTEQFTAAVDAFTSQYIEFKVWTVVIAILLIANYALFKYLIWNKILGLQEKRKTQIKNIITFAGLHVIIIIKVTLAIIFSYYFFTIDFFNIMFFLVIPLAILYKVNLVHPLFVKHKNITKTYRAFMDIGVKKCYVFIVPYFIMAVGLFLLIQYILPALLFLPTAAYVVVYVLSFAAYFSWTKYYMGEVIKKHE